MDFLDGNIVGRIFGGVRERRDGIGGGTKVERRGTTVDERE